MTDREKNALLDLHLWGRVWDESKCRVCGYYLKLDKRDGCVKGNCAMRPVPKHRADEPVDHLTDAQLRLDRQKLPSGAHRRIFLRELRLTILVSQPHAPLTPAEWEWAILSATQHQQREALLGVFPFFDR